jgi:CheY-like chemotaxis protein
MLLSLKRLVEPAFEVTAMADNILSMLDALTEISPDLLVLDIGSTEFGAGNLTRHLLKRYPRLCIVQVGDHDETSPPDTPSIAYVSKQSAEDDLVPRRPGAARGLRHPWQAAGAGRATAPSGLIGHCGSVPQRSHPASGLYDIMPRAMWSVSSPRSF